MNFPTPIGVSPARPQSQRDCVLQPRVARHELPWEDGAGRIGNPKGVVTSAGLKAFSLIEILVVVALLGVIILGLVAMFHQTQRALLGSTTQSDILEAGRATADLLARDLEQVTPCNSANSNAWNFYAQLELQNNNPNTPAVLLQPLLGANDYQTNVMQILFFVSCYNQHWSATGYALDRPDLGVASLYRTNFDLSTNYVRAYGVSNVAAIPQALTDFNNLVGAAMLNKTVPSNFSRIADGVMHLRVRAYGTSGVLVPLMNPAPRALRLNSLNLGTANMGAQLDPPFSSSVYTGDYDYSFNSNAVPAAVELELGILEPRTFERFKALTNNLTAAVAWLTRTNRAAQVHLFRQRIPIRNVDPSAYQ